MMTIASIDTVTDPMVPEMPQTVTEVGVSAETVGAFQQAFNGQVAENENLGNVLREAMVGVSAALAQVEATVAPPVAPTVAPVVVQALPVLVTENAALGQSLQAEKVIVENLLPQIEIKIVSKVVEQPTVTPTVAAPAASAVVQPLPVQVTENVALGQALETVTAVVDEVFTKVETVVAQTATVRPAAGIDAPVAVAPAVVQSVAQTVEPEAAQPIADLPAAPVTVPPLPTQVTENVKLGETLTVATVVVGETLAKVETAVAQPVAQTAAPVAVQPLPVQVAENVKLGETLTVATVVVGETLAKVEAAVTQTATQTATPTVQSAAPEVHKPQSAQMAENVADESPEATADALVATGAVPQTAVQTSAVAETPQAAAVTPVDVVRVQATTEAVPSQVLVQAAEAVADTLLVMPGLLRGQGEVLVRLRPDVLDGTEVKIAVTGRQLEVVFQPKTVDMAVMIENCRTQLVQHLAAKIVSFNVSVDVRKKRS